MDGHSPLFRGGIQAHGLVAAECGTHGHVADFPGPHPLAFHGCAVAALCRRADVAVAPPLQRGGVRDRRLLPFSRLYSHWLPLRAAFHDPLRPHRSHHGVAAHRRADAPLSHSWHVRDTDGHRALHPLKAGCPCGQRTPCAAAEAQSPQAWDSLCQPCRHLPRRRTGAEQDRPEALQCRPPCRRVGRAGRGAGRAAAHATVHQRPLCIDDDTRHHGTDGFYGAAPAA